MTEKNVNPGNVLFMQSLLLYALNECMCENGLLGTSCLTTHLRSKRKDNINAEEKMLVLCSPSKPLHSGGPNVGLKITQAKRIIQYLLSFV